MDGFSEAPISKTSNPNEHLIVKDCSNCQLHINETCTELRPKLCEDYKAAPQTTKWDTVYSYSGFGRNKSNYLDNEIIEVQNYFQSNYKINGKPFQLDSEQAEAILAKAQHVLVSARAGSGKTRVIVGKILYLIDQQKVPINSILVLAFNRNVPKEINHRINNDISKTQAQNQFKPQNLDLTKTFHKLAYSFAKPQGIISNEERAHLVKHIIEELKETTPNFKELVYQTFREESIQIEKNRFKNECDYYKYIRNSMFITLNGEHVKSKGEKWIADFLFEYGIDYIYEKEFYPSAITEGVFDGNEGEQKRCKLFLEEYNDYSDTGKFKKKYIKPDFYLNDYSLVWEHWGIDENEQDPEKKKQFQDIFDISWSEYQARMVWKRKFWQPLWHNRLKSENCKQVADIVSVKKLIETSVTDMQFGRDAFEDKLSGILRENGIPVKKLDSNILIDMLWKRQISRFCELMVSFIDKYEQRYFNKEAAVFEQEIEKYKDNERRYIFLKLGLDVYNRYIEVLKMPNKPKRYERFECYHCDFNQLIAIALKNVENGLVDKEIAEIRYVLIDEYQDFSELFYQFVNSILKRNPKVNLFCVGDNWQAINRFMGADTRYFDSFENYFTGSETVNIATNYRSDKVIIQKSNNFMHDNGIMGAPAKWKNDNNDSSIELINIDDVWLECREAKANTEEYNTDLTYRMLFNLQDRNAQYDQTSARYLKKCIELIEKHKGSSVLILHRKKQLRGKYDLNTLQTRIRKYLEKEKSFTTQDKEHVRFETMHRAKGIEAEIVIVLEANRKNIPLIHPDNELFEAFGLKPEIEMEDENRLFYVALTRAKRNVYFLYDGHVSEFASKCESKPISKIPPTIAHEQLIEFLESNMEPSNCLKSAPK